MCASSVCVRNEFFLHRWVYASSVCVREETKYTCGLMHGWRISNDCECCAVRCDGAASLAIELATECCLWVRVTVVMRHVRCVRCDGTASLLL